MKIVKVLEQDMKHLQQRMEKLESHDQTCSSPKQTSLLCSTLLSLVLHPNIDMHLYLYWV